MKTKRKRVGDKVVTVTVEENDAVVDFADIRKAVKVEAGYGDAPWDESDLYDHEFIKESDLDHDVSDAEGWCTPERRNNGLIRLTGKDWLYKYWRERGASKQVAREKQAEDDKARLKQLVKWYTDGWWHYQITCEFLGEMDSTGTGAIGDDSSDFEFQESIEQDVAENVAHSLIEAGYEVVNMPDRKSEPLYGKAGMIRGITPERMRQLWHMKHGK